MEKGAVTKIISRLESDICIMLDVAAMRCRTNDAVIKTTMKKTSNEVYSATNETKILICWAASIGMTVNWRFGDLIVFIKNQMITGQQHTVELPRICKTFASCLRDTITQSTQKLLAKILISIFLTK